MKVSLVGPAYPLRGGIAHHVYWLCEDLRARGHDVQVISFKKLYPGFLFPGRTVFDVSARKLDSQANALLDPLNPLSWRRACKAIRDFAPDVAVIEWWNPFFAPLTGALARRLHRGRIPCLMECHNVLPHERSRLDAALTRYALSPLSHFITHSQEDRANLLALLPCAAVDVAPLPTIEAFAADDAAARQPARDGRVMLFFGIVRKYKGLDVLLRALPKVLSQVDCHLLISGEFYEPEEKYRRLIDELGIAAAVTLENRYLANEEVAGLMRRADVLVLPYRSATQSAVARLALLNGLPIVAANTGGLAEVVRDHVNGLLFPAGDSDALADALVRYFAEALGPRFAENIRTTCEEKSISVSEVVEAFGQRCGKDAAAVAPIPDVAQESQS